jgi:hypothetical protein
MTQEVELRIIKPEEIFQYWDEISKSKLSSLYDINGMARQFGKIACGEHSAIGFFEHGMFKGIVSFETKQHNVNGEVKLYAVTNIIYAPYRAMEFLPLFMETLKGRGYYKFGGARVGDGKALARLVNAKVVYTYIEKEL